MSKFYAYEELRERFPTKEAVAKARDAVNQDIALKKSDNAVVYGSSAWSMHEDLADVHTRRSDIDIATIDSAPGDFLYSKLTAESGVPIEVNIIGYTPMYGHPTISPSTVDHFKLLERRFPNGYYKAFRKQMETNAGERLDDLVWYVKSIYNEHFHHLVKAKNWSENSYNCQRMDLGDSNELPKILQSLSKLENFPDHITRKVLGIEGMLPYPDTKEKIRKVFMEFPYTWHIRDNLIQYFKQIHSSSLEYEDLLDEVNKGLSRDWYYDVLKRIANNIIDASCGIFSKTISDIGRELKMIRIKEETPVIILEHWRNGGGITVARLLDDFGSKRAGLEYLDLSYDDGMYVRLDDKKREITIHRHNTKKNFSWIKDPPDSNGWFTYKIRGCAGYTSWIPGSLHSIKPCDEDFLKKFKEETNNGKRRSVVKRYYQRFSKEALDDTLIEKLNTTKAEAA